MSPAQRSVICSAATRRPARSIARSARSKRLADSFAQLRHLPEVVRQRPGFWLRLAAFVLDVFGLVVIYTVVYIIGLIVIGQSNAAPDEAIQTRLQLTRVLLIATPWLYYTVAESSRHQGTFGKRMIGLRVVDEAGRRISFARANGRFWSKQLSALTCGVGYVVCAFTQRKQALHDLMSGCYVVSIRR